jgi:hypothetical protein
MSTEGIALAASRYAAIAPDYCDVSNFTGIERKTQNGLQRESEPDCKTVTLYPWSDGREELNKRRVLNLR